MILAVLMVGCGFTKRAYEGSSRSSSEVANLRAHGVRIHTVNGMEIGSAVAEVEILPGKNEVAVSITQGNYNMLNRHDEVFKFSIEAKAGTTYSITGRRGDGRLCAWPIIPETGKPDFQHPAGCFTL